MDWKDACEQAHKRGYEKGYNEAIANITGKKEPCQACYVTTILPGEGPNYCSECGRKLI